MLHFLKCHYSKLSLFTLLFCALQGKAQNSNFDYGKYESPQKYKSTTKFGMACLLWGHVPLTSEYKVLHEFINGPYQSTQLGFSLFSGGPLLRSQNKNATLTKGDKYTLFGFRVQATQKFYFNKSEYAPQGWYAGPHISYASCRFSTQNLLKMGYYIQLKQINACAVIGYQNISSKFASDFYFGLGYKNNSDVVHGGSSRSFQNTTDFYKDLPFYRGNLRVMLGVNIGIAKLLNN